MKKLILLFCLLFAGYASAETFQEYFAARPDATNSAGSDKMLLLQGGMVKQLPAFGNYTTVKKIGSDSFHRLTTDAEKAVWNTNFAVFANATTLNKVSSGGNGGIAVNDVVAKGPWVDVRAFANLSTAKTYAKANSKPLDIYTPQTCTSVNLSGVELGYVVPGAFTACTVTGLKEARPEWWGGKADGVWVSGTDLYGATTGITCTGTDSTAAIAAAVAAVRTAGGNVLYDSGTYLASAVSWASGVNHIGKGTKKTAAAGAAAPSGTVIKQINGTNTDFVATAAANDWIESASIEHIRFIGDPTGAATAGSGLVLNLRMGENTYLNDVRFDFFPDAGIKVMRGVQPGKMSDVHVFWNGYGPSAFALANGSGLYITRSASPSDEMQSGSFDTISGDSNKIALVYIEGGMPSSTSGSGLIFNNVKSEVSVAGLQQNTFVFDSCLGQHIAVNNVNVINTGGEQTANSVFKIIGTSKPVLTWTGASAESETSYIMDDTVATTAQFANTAGTYLNGFYGTIPVVQSGIRFENVATSAGATVLDFYKEEAFTPTISFGGGNTGITYTTQNGRATRIGNRVFFTIHMALSSKGSSTGVALLSGLPYTAGSFLTSAAIRVSGMTSGVGDTHLQVLVNSGATTLSPSKVTTGGAVTLTDADFTNTSSIVINGHYEVS